MSRSDLFGICGLAVGIISLAGLYVVYMEYQTMHDIVLQQQEYTRAMTDYIVNFDNAVSKKLSSDDKIDDLMIKTMIDQFERLDQRIDKIRN